MKKIITIFAALFLICSCISQNVNVYTDREGPELSAGPDEETQNSVIPEKTEKSRENEYDIAGIWTFGDTDFEGCRFEFHRDGILVMASPEITYSGEYSVNYESIPFKLDFYIPEQGNVYTIVRFLDADTIEMANSRDGMARPAAFEDSQILVRIDYYTVR